MSDLPVPAPDPELPEKRGVGRPRGSRRARNPKRLPILSIDFQKSPADQLLPCSEAEQATALSWAIDDVRVTNQSHGLYQKLPMVCQGAACFWAPLCPTRTDFLFQGLPCPILVVEAYSRFVELVKELDVQPDQHVDLDQIADLVRIDVRMKQIDMQIAVDGQMIDQAVGIWQKDGAVKTAKGVHPLLAEQRALRKDRNALYKELIASRDAKKKAEAAEGKREADLLEAFAKVAAKGNVAPGLPGGVTITAEPPRSLAGPEETAEAELVDNESAFPDDDDYDPL